MFSDGATTISRLTINNSNLNVTFALSSSNIGFIYTKIFDSVDVTKLMKMTQTIVLCILV